MRTCVPWHAVGVLGGALVGLATVYEASLPSIATRLNVWFGTDIPLFSQAWMRGLGVRWHWHPLVFAIYDVFGRVVRAFGAEPATLPLGVVALPAIAVTSLGVGVAAAAGARDDRQAIFFVIVTIVVGPCVLMGPIPDTHMAGGAALLAETMLLLAWHRGDGGAGTLLAAACAGGVAGGFSLTNLGPAVALLASCPRPRPRLLLPVAAAAFCAGAALLALLWRHVAFETTFVTPPTPWSCWQSLRQLVLAQFGMPYVAAAANRDPIAPTEALCVDGAAALGVVASCAWLAALPAAFPRDARRSGEARLAVAACASLCALVAFHSIYASREAFLFAPHAWPLVVFPCLAILSDHRSPPLARRATTIVLVTCVLQTALSVPSLLAALGILRGTASRIAPAH